MVLFILTSLFQSFFIQQVFAQETPNAAHIVEVQLDGSDCDARNTQLGFSPDLKSLSLLFDEYILEMGEGTELPEALRAQKRCRIWVLMEVPEGWQMAFQYMDYRGYTNLPEVVTGNQTYSFFMRQSGPPVHQQVPLKGPINEDYFFRFNVNQKNWSHCNRSHIRFFIDSQMELSYLRRTSERPLAQIILDSADLNSHQDFGVSWRRCTPGNDDPRFDRDSLPRVVERPHPRGNRPPRHFVRGAKHGQGRAKENLGRKFR
jgi:hypothetical protein